MVQKGQTETNVQNRTNRFILSNEQFILYFLFSIIFKLLRLCFCFGPILLFVNSCCATEWEHTAVFRYIQYVNKKNMYIYFMSYSPSNMRDAGTINLTGPLFG